MSVPDPFSQVDEGKSSRSIPEGRGGADEGRRMPLVRGQDEAQRQDQGGDAAVEVPLVRGVDDPLLRRRGGEARGVPLVAHIEGDAALMWQQGFGQIYERVRPASLNPTGVM